MIKLSLSILALSACYVCSVKPIPPEPDKTSQQQCSKKIPINVTVKNNTTKDPIIVDVYAVPVGVNPKTFDVYAGGNYISSSSQFVSNTSGRVKKAYLCYENGVTTNRVRFRSTGQEALRTVDISSQEGPSLSKIEFDRKYSQIKLIYKKAKSK